MATGTRARGRHAAALSTRRAAMQRPLWHKLVAWALALALAGAAATLVVGDEQPASGAPDALGSADRARLAVAGLAGLSLFLIATLHQERKGESAEGFAIAGAGASTAAAVSCAGLALVSSAAELAAVRALALVLIGSIAALSGFSQGLLPCLSNPLVTAPHSTSPSEVPAGASDRGRGGRHPRRPGHGTHGPVRHCAG